MEMMDKVYTGFFSVLSSVGLFSLIIKGQNVRLTALENEKVSKPTCNLLRDNTTLKINQHVSEQINTLKDEVFEELRQIKDAVNNDNNQTNKEINSNEIKEELKQIKDAIQNKEC